MIPGLPDLHRHLDGSLRPETVAALAGAAGFSVPPDLCFFDGMGLDAALSRTDAALEHGHARALPGMDDDRLRLVIAAGHAAAFE